MTDLATSPKPSSPGVDLSRIRALVEPVARAEGAELVDVEWTTEGRGFVLRISVDKAGSAEKKASTEDSAVDLEVCSNISRAVSQSLDENDPFPPTLHYSLEVGSPGVERALRTEADYDRFEGKKAKLRLTTPIDGQKVLVGLLSGVKSGELTLVDGPKTHVVPLAHIASGRLVFELGATPKPRPKPGKKNRK